jgi:hypothetical protein
MGEHTDHLMVRLGKGVTSVRRHLRKADSGIEDVEQHTRRLTIPEQHQLKIAKDTLKMPGPMAGVMGGPSPEEARKIVARLEAKQRAEKSPYEPTVSPHEALRREKEVSPATRNAAGMRGLEKLRKTTKKSERAEPGTIGAVLEAKAGAPRAEALTPSGHRPLNRIYDDIAKDWSSQKGGVNFAAAPYLDAMRDLNDITDNYYADSASSVVSYFLSNASSWRGPKAKEIKAELKAILKKR